VTYTISVPRLQDILRAIYGYLGEHNRHASSIERRRCGCDPQAWIAAGADVPEYDADRTAAGWEQERGPLGFALTDGTWIEYGDGWEAVRREDPDDRRSPIAWYAGPHGNPLRRVENGGWMVAR
jgi:hypothetical protein